MKTKTKFNLLTFIIIAMPILNVYATPIKSFGFGSLLVALCIPFLVIDLFKMRNVINKKYVWLIVFYFYSIFITLLNVIINNYSVEDALIRLLVETFYICCIIIVSSSGKFDISKGKKYYRFFALLVSFGIIAQAIAFYSFSTNLYLLIPGLKYNQSSLATFDVYKATYDYMFKYYFRPTSFFLEPSHAALYLCPFLLMTLFSNTKKSIDYFACAISTIAVFLTTAGTGILLAAAIWVMFIIYDFVKNKRHRFLIFASLLFALALFVFAKENFDFFNRVVTLLTRRLDSLEVGGSSSINVRIFKGFEFFNSLSVYEKIFGMGMGTYDSYIIINPTVSIQFQFEYMNSIAYLFCSTGIIGFLLFAYSIYCASKNSNCTYKLALFIVVFLMYLTGSTLYNSYDFVYYLILFSPKLVDDRNVSYLLKKQTFISHSTEEKYVALKHYE